MRRLSTVARSAKVDQTSPMFDAVLIVSFGGPQGMADVRPFLANVLRGRRVSPERVAGVTGIDAELFGPAIGRSRHPVYAAGGVAR